MKYFTFFFGIKSLKSSVLLILNSTSQFRVAIFQTLNSRMWLLRATLPDSVTSVTRTKALAFQCWFKDCHCETCTDLTRDEKCKLSLVHLNDAPLF